MYIDNNVFLEEVCGAGVSFKIRHLASKKILRDYILGYITQYFELSDKPDHFVDAIVALIDEEHSITNGERGRINEGDLAVLLVEKTPEYWDMLKVSRKAG